MKVLRNKTYHEALGGAAIVGAVVGIIGGVIIGAVVAKKALIKRIVAIGTTQKLKAQQMAAQADAEWRETERDNSIIAHKGEMLDDEKQVH